MKKLFAVLSRARRRRVLVTACGGEQPLGDPGPPTDPGPCGRSRADPGRLQAEPRLPTTAPEPTKAPEAAAPAARASVTLARLDRR